MKVQKLTPLWFVLALTTAGCGESGSSTGSASGSAAPTTSTATKPPASASAKPSAAPASSAPATPAGTGAIAKMMADVQVNPDNYKDKPLKVDGLYMSTSTSESGGKKSYTVSITDAKGDLDHTLGCSMGDTAPPEGLKQYDALTIEGKGNVGNSMKGDQKFKSISVMDCKVTKK